MIVLDSNVISALMRGADSDARAVRWASALTEQPVTAVIVRAEILSGIALLPDGKRKSALRRAADDAFTLVRDCLPLLPSGADEYAAVIQERSAAGRPIGKMNALIAAIARVNNAGIATRDTADFDGLGLRLVNPWEAG